MTSDTPTIPAPPPGWAIVPADDARLDCLPCKPQVFEARSQWTTSSYEKGDKVTLSAKRDLVYALPIEPQPWSLPAPPAGQAWHRQDWTAEMLPEGYRPLLMGETRQAVDEWSYEPHEADSWKRVEYFGPDGLMMVEGRCSHHRTRRPLLASQPEQASPAEDEVVTWAQQAAAENRQVCNNLSAAERQGLMERAKAIIGTTDPKGEAGKAKAPLALLPPEALRQAAWAHSNGAAKYGAFNWRENKVCATTYISAMMRHIGQYLDGEDADAESGLSHLAHVIASANILIDAKHCGTLVDDRPKRPA